MKLQMNLFLHMKVHMQVQLEALPNGARCFDDLAVHYRLKHAVLMVGRPNHIYYWDYNPLIARSG